MIIKLCVDTRVNDGKDELRRKSAKIHLIKQLNAALADWRGGVQAAEIAGRESSRPQIKALDRIHTALLNSIVGKCRRGKQSHVAISPTMKLGPVAVY